MELRAYLQSVGYRLSALALAVLAVAGAGGLAVAQRPTLALMLAGTLLGAAALAELEGRQALRRARTQAEPRWSSSISR